MRDCKTPRFSGWVVITRDVAGMTIALSLFFAVAAVSLGWFGDWRRNK